VAGGRRGEAGSVDPPEKIAGRCITIVSVKIGDVLSEVADVLICPANPWLNLSGGVNGALLQRGGQSVQDELHAHLKHSGRRAVESGTIVATGPGPLAVNWILHAVAIDPFYDSSIDLVSLTIAAALDRATDLQGRTVAMPMLATGYGRLSTQDFGAALAKIRCRDWPGVQRLTVVVRNDEDSEILRSLLSSR